MASVAAWVLWAVSRRSTSAMAASGGGGGGTTRRVAVCATCGARGFAAAGAHGGSFRGAGFTGGAGRFGGAFGGSFGPGGLGRCAVAVDGRAGGAGGFLLGTSDFGSCFWHSGSCCESSGGGGGGSTRRTLGARASPSVFQLVLLLCLVSVCWDSSPCWLWFASLLRLRSRPNAPADESSPLFFLGSGSPSGILGFAAVSGAMVPFTPPSAPRYL
mmetsp:Transcript_123024/g.244860  ORF Transcript_123024/g.244860 Transcript_123024/m.244860 type:complete len:215 (-) Transcript_123024:1640-2284(-)